MNIWDFLHICGDILWIYFGIKRDIRGNVSMRKVGFQTQILVVISVFLFLLNFVIGWFMVDHAKFALRKQIEERMLDITNTARL